MIAATSHFVPCLPFLAPPGSVVMRCFADAFNGSSQSCLPCLTLIWKAVERALDPLRIVSPSIGESSWLDALDFRDRPITALHRAGLGLERLQEGLELVSTIVKFFGLVSPDLPAVIDRQERERLTFASDFFRKVTYLLDRVCILVCCLLFNLRWYAVFRSCPPRQRVVLKSAVSFAVRFTWHGWLLALFFHRR